MASGHSNKQGRVVYKITNYFGSQAVQIGDQGSIIQLGIETAELLSGNKDLSGEGINRDDLLKGTLNSILNPKHSLTLKEIEERFQKIYGAHLPDGMQTFEGVSGVPLDTFLKRYETFFNLTTTSKGKLMITSKPCIGSQDTLKAKSDSTLNIQTMEDRQNGNTTTHTAPDTTDAKEKAKTKKSSSNDACDDIVGWEKVVTKRQKKFTKAANESTKSSDKCGSESQSNHTTDPGFIFLHSLIGRKSGNDLKFVSTDTAYFQNFLLFTTDVVSMWNTPHDSSSYIIIGIDDTFSVPYTIKGMKKSHRLKDYQDIFLKECVTGSFPEYTYSEVTLPEGRVGVLEIFRSHGKQTPAIMNCNRKNDVIETREGDLWIRRGGSGVVCKPTDDTFASVYRWFAERPQPPATHLESDNLSVSSSSDDSSHKTTIVYSQRPKIKCEKTDSGLIVCTSTEEMLDAVNHFRKGHFILLAGDVPKGLQNLDAVSLIPWISVLDFDPYSRDGGLCGSNEEPMSRSKSLQITTWKTMAQPVSEHETNWCFVRGSRADPESRECFPEDKRRWYHTLTPFLSKYVDHVQNFVLDYTVLTSVVVWPRDESMLPHIQKIIACLDDSIEPPPKLVIILDKDPSTENGKTMLRLMCEEQKDNLTIVRMNLKDVLCGLKDNLKMNTEVYDVVFDLPAANNRDVCICDKDASWLRTDLNVLFKSNPFTKGENDVEVLQEESDNFYRGGTLQWSTWYACEAGHFDAERDIHKETKVAIESLLEKNKSGMVTICHSPGAGGTTFAQRVVWDFHERIPTVHIRTNMMANLTGIVTKVEFLYNKTRKPVLILIDGEDEQKVFHLLQYLKTSCIAMILFVKRCLAKPQVSSGESAKVWLSGIVSQKEAKQLALKLAAHCKDEVKKRALHRLCKDIEQGTQHHLISFGLTVFLHEFKGVSSFVRGYIPMEEHHTTLSADQKILVFLSLAYFYGHSSLPCQFFSELLYLPPNYCIDMEDFPHQVQVFAVLDEGDGKKANMRISHFLIAKEILQHILSRGKILSDSRQSGLCKLARSRLASLCLDFIAYASRRKTRRSASSNTIINCLTKIFIIRDTLDLDHGAETQTRKSPLSHILTDINSISPLFRERLEVLKKLVEAFPDDPSFIAHLGRFYANCLPEKEKEAERCFLKSIELCEVHTKGTKTSDSKLYDRWNISLMYIYHMYGTFLLKRLKRETGKGTFDDIEVGTQKTALAGNIEELLVLTKQACSLFENSRKYTPVGHERGYGYRGEIEVRLQFCDFLQREATVCILGDSIRTSTSIRNEVKVFIRRSIPIIDQLVEEFAQESTGQREIGYYINKYWCWYKHMFKGKEVAMEQVEDCQDADSCRLKIAMTKVCNTSDRGNSCTIDDIKNQKDIEDIVELYERVFEMVVGCDSYRERKTLETNLCDWLRAIRHKEMTAEYSIDQVLIQVASIDHLIASPISKFYLFILKSLIGFGIDSGNINTDALLDANQLKLDLKALGKQVLKSRFPREWIGNSGTGIQRLIQCIPMFTDHKQTRCVSLFQVYKGTVGHPNTKRLAGNIKVDLGENTCPVEAFFIPDVAGLTGTHNSGRRVEFTIAFSIEHGYEAFYVTLLKKYKCTNYPCSATVEITSAEEFGVCCACKRPVYRNDILGDSD